jgi:hypothetical protein
LFPQLAVERKNQQSVMLRDKSKFKLKTSLRPADLIARLPIIRIINYHCRIGINSNGANATTSSFFDFYMDLREQLGRLFLTHLE